MSIQETLSTGGVYVIAEIGCSHAGSMATAKQMIDAAAWAGVDAVKSQKRDLSAMSEEVRNRPYNSPHSFGATYGEHREALELTMDQHVELKYYSESKGLDYSISVWDMQSAHDAVAAGFEWVKVPSACATDYELVATLGETARTVVVSTGMCTEREVLLTSSALVAREEFPEAYVLHAVSAYPLENEDSNLHMMTQLEEKYVPYPYAAFGLSGHHRGIQIDMAAIGMGARILERHFTLDRAAKGTDHAASLEPDGMRRLARDARETVKAFGHKRRRVLECEKPALAKLRAR